MVPGKASEEDQRQFLKELRELKRDKKPEDKLIYMDGVHPQHNSLPSYGWLLIWKFFKKKVLYNQYCQTFLEFRNACLGFFSKSNLGKFKKELTSLLTDNFQIVSA